MSVQRRSWSPRGILFIASVCVLGLGALAFVTLRGGEHTEVESAQPKSALGIPVNTIRPTIKTLERTLDQPGSIQPWAQAELFAKASGSLKRILREPTPHLATDFVLQPSGVQGSSLVCLARLAMTLHAGRTEGPQINIGSLVHAGDALLEIDIPERAQEVVEKQTLVRQREAELESARTALATYEASFRAAQAQITQAKADMRRYESEYDLRHKELKRLQDLVKSRTVAQEIADEKQHQVNAAQAAWESSQAKIQAVQAELAVISSKFATAQADIKVKETLVQVARDAVRLATLIADYGKVYAPFNGMITYRGVDEGDFIQNATSGQSRRLLTVTAMDKVRVIVQVPDRDAAWVEVGAEAVVVVDSRVGKAFKGFVTRIAHALDPQTRTMQAEIDLDNHERHLRPGMYGKVVLMLQRIPDARAIPATAVYSRKGENFILQVEDGIARRQRVRIRFDDGKEMEVVKLMGTLEVPLTGTEELIVSNKGEIAEGQRVVATPVKAGKSKSGVKRTAHLGASEYGTDVYGSAANSHGDLRRSGCRPLFGWLPLLASGRDAAAGSAPGMSGLRPSAVAHAGENAGRRVRRSPANA